MDEDAYQPDGWSSSSSYDGGDVEGEGHRVSEGQGRSGGAEERDEASKSTASAAAEVTAEDEGEGTGLRGHGGDEAHVPPDGSEDGSSNSDSVDSGGSEAIFDPRPWSERFPDLHQQVSAAIDRLGTGLYRRRSGEV